MTGKEITGLGLIVGGIVLGVYVGIWVCLIGGIVDILNEVKSIETLDNMVVAWGAVKILLAGFFGGLSGFVLVLPGWVMIDR